MEGLEKTTVLDVPDTVDVVCASREAGKRNSMDKNRLIVISQAHSLSIAIRLGQLATTKKGLATVSLIENTVGLTEV